MKGWIRLHSFTEPTTQIFSYQPWLMHWQGQWQPAPVCEHRRQSKGFIIKLSGCDQPEIAAQYTHTQVAIPRSRLPAAEEGSYYWHDLVGCEVIDLDGNSLGTVDHLFETRCYRDHSGKQKRLIPYIPHGD